MADICRKAGISQATYFNWKRKYDGLLPTEMRRLKQLEEQQAAEGRGGSEPRQGDASGRYPPKALRPVRKRKLVDEDAWDNDNGDPGFQFNRAPSVRSLPPGARARSGQARPPPDITVHENIINAASRPR